MRAPACLLALSLPLGSAAPASAQGKLDLPPGRVAASKPDPCGRYNGFVYERPLRVYTWITNAPGDIADYGRETFRRENAWPIAFVVGSTALLIWKDQWIVDKAYELGDRLHISHANDQRTLFSVKAPGLDYRFYFQGPYDSGSALYYIGDGWVDFYAAGGFLAGGFIAKDNRQLQTASQILESVLASGAIVQLLKHVTGRESPFVATRKGGRWVPFPNQIAYHKNVPHYDAFPSGHLAAGMATVTVIAENYSEYRFIRPLGYTLMGLLGFQMLNNGVHWASDYPLAVTMGYTFGRIAVRKGRKPCVRTSCREPDFSVSPELMGLDAVGMAARWRFGG